MMVPRTGLEPVRVLPRRILSPVRLPIPPPRRLNALGLVGDGGATQIRTGGRAFAELCLTTWLWRRLANEYGADEGIRTLDPRLGKAMLYH